MQRSLRRSGEAEMGVSSATRAGSNRAAENPSRQDAPRALRREGASSALERAFQEFRAARREKTPRFSGRGSRTVAAAGERTWTEATPQVAGRYADAEDEGRGALSRSDYCL